MASEKVEPSPDALVEAERLRIRGNDAFGTKHWERALELYQQSVALDSVSSNAAKTYSNMAATYCKMGFYEYASEAAEAGTAADENWAKGWWRRGVVAELQKEFHRALMYYSKAVELDSENRAFQKALKDMADRLGTNGETGMPTLGRMPETVRVVDSDQAAGVVPSFRAKERVEALGREEWKQQNFLKVSTESWIVRGIYTWIDAMKSAYASMAMEFAGHQPDCARVQTALVQALRNPTNMTPEGRRAACLSILGAEPDPKAALDALSGAYTHLTGQYVALESSPPFRFTPSPPYLDWLRNQQFLAPMFLIANIAMELSSSVFGSDAVMSLHVLSACRTYWSNTGVTSPPRVGEPGKPKEVLEYCEEQLQAGKTWDGGMRRFVSLQYRGTLMYGAFLRFMGQLAEAHKCSVWAREFITLADGKWKVREEKTFQEKGSVFTPSFQIGMLMVEAMTYQALRDGQINVGGGAYMIDHEIYLLHNIIDLANSEDIISSEDDPVFVYTFRDRPLAFAHAGLAHLLNRVTEDGPEHFDKFVSHFELHDGNDNANSFAIIAEHYRLAAEAQIPDADDAAILWWGFAACMTRAGNVRGNSATEPAGYTMGELREAIRKAIVAAEARDVGLWGEDKQRGGSFETQAKQMARHYREKPDSFIIPELEFQVDRKGSVLLIAGGEIICNNFEECMKLEAETKIGHHKEKDGLMDTSKVEQVYGADRDQEVPPLSVLCMRALHEQEHELAIGETEPEKVISKAMACASTGAADSST